MENQKAGQSHFTAAHSQSSGGWLCGKVFFLVLAGALLWQAVLFTQQYARRYHDELKNSFQVLLALPARVSEKELGELAGALGKTEGVVSADVFSAQDALDALQRRNPQLAENIRLLGTPYRLPAYIALRLDDKAVANITAFTGNLAVAYPQLDVHYDARHARMAANAGLFCQILRVGELAVLLALLVFMFLVEAAPAEGGRALRGVCSGLLAGLCACGAAAGVLYTAGYLPEMWGGKMVWPEQALLLVLCGLLGWTFSKWQKF